MITGMKRREFITLLAGTALVGSRCVVVPSGSLNRWHCAEIGNNCLKVGIGDFGI